MRPTAQGLQAAGTTDELIAVDAVLQWIWVCAEHAPTPHTAPKHEGRQLASVPTVAGTRAGLDKLYRAGTGHRVHEITTNGADK